MNFKLFIKEYQEFLETNANPEKAAKEKAYLFSDLKHHGLYTQKRAEFYRQHKTALKQLNKNEALDLVQALWAQPSFEERCLALSILNLHQESLGLDDMPLIEKLIRESKGWAFLDSLIIPLMPGILERHPKAYKYLKTWIKNDDFWVRRSALLAQLLFFRSGEGGDKKLFFEMAQSQLDESWIDKVYSDTENRKRARFFIRKAIGWVLREMSGKDPAAVVQFLNSNKGRLSGLSYREGSRRLPQSWKNQLK